nr:MAG TPA: hypothetical protein [Caudoviricetes sp.]
MCTESELLFSRLFFNLSIKALYLFIFDSGLFVSLSFISYS